jgi:hypothetical protein
MQNAKCKISLESLMKLKNLEIVVISKPIKRPILPKFICYNHKKQPSA